MGNAAQLQTPEIEFAEESMPYTLVYNQLIFDDRLRWQTRGILIAMLSRPKDWDFSVRGMAKIAHVSKDTMAKTIRELEVAGYVKRKMQTRKSGRFGKSGFIVSGRPIFDPAQEEASPCPNLSYTKVSYTKTSPQQNKEQQSKEQIEPPIVPQEGDLSEMLFERFWNAYPKIRHQKKKDAKKAWDKLHPDIELCRRMAVALEAQKRSEAWTKEGGQYIPLPASWIRGERWDDEITIPAPDPPDRPPETWEDRFGWK